MPRRPRSPATRSASRSALGSPLLPSWITDKDGTPIMEEKPVFDRDDFFQAPLGGTREQGSHKGYGFAMMAEVLSTMLSGALPTMLVPGQRIEDPLRRVQHRGVHRRRAVQGHDGRDAQDAPHGTPAPDHERVLYPGLSEAEELRGAPREGHPAAQGSAASGSRECTRELGIAPLGYEGLVLRDRSLLDRRRRCRPSGRWPPAPTIPRPGRKPIAA